VLASCVFGVALLPLIVLVKDDQHLYQYYKLLLSISPLLVLGLALLWQPPSAAVGSAPRLKNWQPALLTCGSLLVMLCAEAAGTGQMVWQTTPTRPHPRSQAPVLLAEDMRAARTLLEDLPAGDLLLVTNGIYGPLYNSWFSYFGRQHQIWLTSPDFIDIELARSVPPESITTLWQCAPKKLPSGRLVHVRPLPRALDLKSLPPGAIVLEQCVPGFQQVARGDSTELWAGQAFRLWKSSSGRWAVPLQLETPYGMESAEGRPFFWMGEGETTLEVLASCPGTVTLSGSFVAGPAMPTSSAGRLQVRTSAGRHMEVPIAGGPKTLTVAVEAGRTSLWLRPLDRPVPRLAAPQADPRTLLVAVHELGFGFTAASEEQ
jgi:hypothetical protein